MFCGRQEIALCMVALLHLMASTIQQQICLAAKKASMYSILADETKDNSKDEQLAIVIR